MKACLLASSVSRKPGSVRMMTLFSVFYLVTAWSTTVKSCSEHGGLLTYIRDDFSYKISDKYYNASSWEGVFVDVFSEQLHKQIHIGNIYRPPKNNNNNQSIDIFIEEFSPVVDTFSKNMSHGVIVGDFNIKILQIQEREKFGDFFDLMCVNGFLPEIILPTRFARKSCSLID